MRSCIMRHISADVGLPGWNVLMLASEAHVLVLAEKSCSDRIEKKEFKRENKDSNESEEMKRDNCFKRNEGGDKNKSAFYS